ncbi:MAG: hypothetical protein H0W83_05650, partial [Planctomycetes bacterium]|nr:hypothetical protein [Planctomycetota bacterium]
AAEIARILTASRFSDARRRLAELRQTRTWLDDAELARDVDLAEARFHAQQHDYEESARILLDLRKRYPQDLLVCRSLVEDLCESNRQDGVRGAAVQFADATPGELLAEILETLKRGFRNTGRYGEEAKRLRALLIAHDSTFVNAMRAELDSDEHGDRVNAYSVLTDVKQLTPDQELRYHVKNLVMLSSSYSEAGEAIDYLRDAGDKPGWTEHKRAAGIKPITEVKALESDDEHASKVMPILTGPLLAESREQLARWATGDDEFADKNGCLRANAFRALREAGLAPPTLIEPWAFHERSLRTFHMGQEPFWFTEAVDFFRAQTAKRPAEAKAVLQACAARLEENIAGYKRAQMNPNFQRAPMRELGIVRAAMDGKPPP